MYFDLEHEYFTRREGREAVARQGSVRILMLGVELRMKYSLHHHEFHLLPNPHLFQFSQPWLLVFSFSVKPFMTSLSVSKDSEYWALVEHPMDSIIVQLV